MRPRATRHWAEFRSTIRSTKCAAFYDFGGFGSPRACKSWKYDVVRGGFNSPSICGAYFSWIERLPVTQQASGSSPVATVRDSDRLLNCLGQDDSRSLCARKANSAIELSKRIG